MTFQISMCGPSVAELRISRRQTQRTWGLRPLLSSAFKVSNRFVRSRRTNGPLFRSADKQHCVSLAKTGGESSNTELLTCLEMARDVRALRSAETNSSAKGRTGQAPPLPSASTVQPAPADSSASRAHFNPMSALPPKADFVGMSPTSALCQKPTSKIYSINLVRPVRALMATW